MTHCRYDRGTGSIRIPVLSTIPRRLVMVIATVTTPLQRMLPKNPESTLPI
jgi:hypothetical protein